MGGTGQGMGWGKERERRKGSEREERGCSPKLYVLAPPLVRSQSRSLKVVPFYRFGVVSY